GRPCVRGSNRNIADGVVEVSERADRDGRPVMVERRRVGGVLLNMLVAVLRGRKLIDVEKNVDRSRFLDCGDSIGPPGSRRPNDDVLFVFEVVKLANGEAGTKTCLAVRVNV